MTKQESGGIEVNATYDPEVDALYVDLRKSEEGLMPIHETVELIEARVMLDIAKDNTVIGLEVIGVKELLKKLI